MLSMLVRRDKGLAKLLSLSDRPDADHGSRSPARHHLSILPGHAPVTVIDTELTRYHVTQRLEPGDEVVVVVPPSDASHQRNTENRPANPNTSLP